MGTVITNDKPKPSEFLDGKTFRDDSVARRAYFRSLREWCIAEGLCAYCRKRDARGKTSCELCAQQIMDRTTEYRRKKAVDKAFSRLVHLGFVEV